MGTGANENIAITISTTADLSGTTAVRQDLGLLGKAAQETTGLLGKTAEDAAAGFDKIPTKTRTAANSLGFLTQAALTGDASMAGLARSAGTFAASLATISDSAELAAGAAGLGAMIVVGTLAYEVFEKLNSAAKASTVELDHIGKLTLTQTQTALEETAARMAAAQTKAAALAKLADQFDMENKGHPNNYAGDARVAQKELERQSAAYAEIYKRSLELAHAENVRLTDVKQGTQDELQQTARLITLEKARIANAGTLDETRSAAITRTATLERAASDEQAKAAAQSIVLRFRHRDATGQIVALTADESKEMQELLRQNTTLAGLRDKQINQAATLEQQELQRAQALNGLRAKAADTTTDPVERYQASLALFAAERDEDIRKGTLSQIDADAQVDANKKKLILDAANFERSLADKAAARESEGVLNSFDQERAAALRSYSDQLTASQLLVKDKALELATQRELTKELVATNAQIDRQQALANAAAKNALLANSHNPLDQLQGRIAEINAAAQAEIKAGIATTTATLDAEAKKQQAIRETGHALLATFESSIQAGESFRKALTKALVSPLVSYLDGLAETQAVEALASAASLDFQGALLHTAAAAAALGAAAKVGALAGLGGGGGGGGGSAGSGGGGGSTFSSPTPNAGSPTIVQLYTSDPYNRQNIMIASYALNRAGITKRPIYLPPTTGLQAGPG